MRFDPIELTRAGALFFDGGTGTLLQARGLGPGECPELWNAGRPEEIVRLHMDYLEAGAQILKTNTFGANGLKFSPEELKQVITAGVRCAKEARERAGREGNAFVALDLGPTGKLLEPMGELVFEEAVSLFREAAVLGAAAGADLILIETMTDSLEARAAVLGAKEAAPDVPVVVTLTFEETGRLLTGASPAALAVMLEGLGVCAIGINCGAGPERAALVLPELLAAARVPVVVNPNAGLPVAENGIARYDLSPEAFAAQAETLFELGASVFGGCCGTTPAHIKALVERLRSRIPLAPQGDERPAVSSARGVVRFGGAPVLIGERINPTGKKAFQQALREGGMDYIIDEAAAQEEAGAHVLDVNVGLPGIDERETMLQAVTRLQQHTPLPLQIDSADPAVLEAAMRRYNGRALVNSVNGKEESMRAVFPLIKKYGGVAVALLLDEDGIPSTVEGRLAIAEKIYRTAEEYSIRRQDILIDALTLTVSSDPASAAVTLATVRAIRERFGGYTVLGVSNISFGLPRRELVNAAFFTMALQAGLSAAIINPKSGAMMNAYRSFCLLNGMDPGCKAYLAYAAQLPEADTRPAAPAENLSAAPAVSADTLFGAIVLGREEAAKRLAEAGAAPPLDLIKESVIPALDEVGRRFAKGTLFLPQLLQSAAAAKAALAVLQERLRLSGRREATKGVIVLATVQGDIHDIGKNIVKTLLETYHFTVIDLGKNVSPQAVADAVVGHHAPLCGLSALMTTTVPSMEATIKLLRERAPWCRVLAGGAVLTQAYADDIGADAYCADAMAGVKKAEAFLNS
ncbi:MAG: homocysteine S-methyltransferase family protein [Oscillospiraceae bacterium]|nr:homocysteine S-methyltransferase family protein [Oscillospiraceae bacterium]